MRSNPDPLSGPFTDPFNSPFADPCLAQNAGRRRAFWTTRAQVCGSYVVCGTECSIPGLEYEDSDAQVVGGRTIRTDEWLLSLILNILNTKARTDIKCPAPAGVFGHWSESYRDDGLYVGSLLWNAAAKPYVRIADGVKAITAAIQADMGKLIANDVADKVEVEAIYAGHNRVQVNVTAIVQRNRHVFNLSGALVADSWVWN